MMTDADLSFSKKAHSLLIRYPRFTTLHNSIELCREVSKIAGEAQCMSLEGSTGAGKTTLIRDYAKAFHRRETTEGTEIPVFYLETPSPVTVKGMAVTMLQRLGDPAARKGTLTDMNDRLINYLIHCHLQLIILDDFHHLIDSETDHVLQAVSDWLKVLIKESGVPFLVVGIEHKVQRILEANSQLSRLFPVREMLEPLQWLATDTKRTREFAAFVNIMEKQIGLPLAPNVARAELLTRLHYATDGVVGNLMNLIRFSTLSAVQQNVQHIEMAILAATFDKYLSKHLMDKVNPFDASWGATFIAPNRTFYDRPEATGNRSRQRKKHVRTANELLKTS